MVTRRLSLRAVYVVATMALFNNGCGVVADNYSPDRDRGSIDGGRQLQESNWDINYLGLTGDLSVNSTDELVMNFEIGKDRVVAAELLAKDCVDNITGIDINVTAPVITPHNDTHGGLRLGYSLEKSMITGSNIWNATRNQIEFCQVVQLIVPANGTAPMMVITQDKRKVVIDVDLSVDFAFTQAISVELSQVIMKIPSSLSVSNVGPASSPEERASLEEVVEKTITDIATGGLKEGQVLVNATMVNSTVLPDAVRRRTLLGTNGDDLVELHQPQARKLASLAVDYEIVIKGSCANATACAITMYEDVTSHMSENIDDGSFTDTLQANARSVNLVIAQEAQAYDPDFEDPEIEVIEPPGPIISYGYGATDVNSYLEACRCDGAQSFTCNTDTLFPNGDLFICVKSVSSDVEVDFLDSMFITQAVTTLGIIETNQVQFPSFTSREYVPGMNGVAVSTRVPSNLFSYGTDEFITITGVIVMKLAGSDRKLLAVAASDANFEEKAPFQLKINLARESKPAENTANSATVTSCEGFAVMGVIFSFVYAMLW